MQYICTFSIFTILAASSQLHAQQQWGGGFDKEIEWSGIESGLLGSSMGTSLDTLGDINGDGLIDFIAGAPNTFSTAGLPGGGMVEVRSGADGSLLFRHRTAIAGGGMGKTVAGLEDQNGDGMADYAFNTADGVEIHSGANGTLLRQILAPAGLTYRYGLVGAGDLNGDSVEDLLIFAFDEVGASPVIATSGADGSILWMTYSATTFGHPRALASIPDVSGDGIRDCISGGNVFPDGEVVLYSGADGSILNTWSGSGQIGLSVCGVGDYNSDGVEDFAYSEPHAQVGSQSEAGIVTVISGADYSVLRTFEGSPELPQLGFSICNAGDVDGDGFPDLASSAYIEPAKVAIFSGQTGEKIYIINRILRHVDRVTTIKGLGDYDADGDLDLLLGAPGAAQPITGAVYVYGFQDFLSSTVSSISAAAGGTVAFDVDFPGDNWIEANRLRYRLLFSGSGTGPTQIFGWNTPLSSDALLDLGLNGTYPSIFQNPDGQLDADGKAVVTLQLAPGIATSLVGTTLHFSAMQYETVPGGSVYVHGPSRAVSVQILP